MLVELELRLKAGEVSFFFLHQIRFFKDARPSRRAYPCAAIFLSLAPSHRAAVRNGLLAVAAAGTPGPAAAAGSLHAGVRPRVRWRRREAHVYSWSCMAGRASSAEGALERASRSGRHRRVQDGAQFLAAQGRQHLARGGRLPARSTCSSSRLVVINNSYSLHPKLRDIVRILQS